MKMLMFDFRESEKEFFNTNEFPDIDITFIPEPLNEMSQLTEEQLRDTDIISVFISSNVTEEVIKKFKNLRVITTRSTGYNHIDIKYCSENNITVFNVESYGRESVAQFTITLILALIRNLLSAYLDTQRNMINHSDYEGYNLDNLTIGIIGCGAIGSSVAKIAHFFGMKVLVCSYAKHPEVTFADYVSMDELLSQSDIVTLHIPYNPEIYHMIGEKEISKMKDGAFIINTARGELLDVVALYENLINGKLKGAALDVLECEYMTLDQNTFVDNIKEENSKCITNALITQKLLGLNNVIITPHIAYNTHESVQTILNNTFINIRNYVKGARYDRIC